MDVSIPAALFGVAFVFVLYLLGPVHSTILCGIGMVVLVGLAYWWPLCLLAIPGLWLLYMAPSER